MSIEGTVRASGGFVESPSGNTPPSTEEEITMPDMVSFKYGEFNALPDSTTNGTIYVAKAADGKAYMYVDKDGEKLNITSPNTNFYGVCTTARTTDEKTITVPGLFQLVSGTAVTIQFTDGINLNNATLNINNLGAKNIRYRNSLGTNKGLAKNTVFTLVYDGSSFQLIGDINEVNNGISMTAAYDTNYHPLLIAAAQGPQDFDENNFTKSMLAVTNPDAEITASIDIGRLNAPGGLYAHTGRAVDANETRATYNSEGIKLWGNFNTGTYSEWSIYPDAAGNLVFNGVGDMGYAQMHLNLENDTLYANNASIAHVYAYEIQQNGNRVPNLFYGTTKPTSDIGQNGDIYIMYS